MQKSLRIFLDSIIDYAGIFPPAELSLEKAYQNFIKYQKDDLNWIISNFICPAGKLDSLNLLIRKNSSDNILPLSLIIKPEDNEKLFFDSFNRELKLIEIFKNDLPGKVKVNCFEIKLPAAAFMNKKSLAESLERISSEIKNTFDDNIFIFYEVISGDAREKNIETLADAISYHNEIFNDSGFKLRTGGVDDSSFPAPEHIVYALRRCIERGISFKATAGLHHPFRHYNDSVKTKMHGFINLFGAGIIAYRHNISDKEMIEMLEEEDPSEFKFTDEAFNYEGWEISNDEIALARKEFMISFGSCSVDEPIDDLKKINSPPDPLS